MQSHPTFSSPLALAQQAHDAEMRRRAASAAAAAAAAAAASHTAADLQARQREAAAQVRDERQQRLQGPGQAQVELSIPDGMTLAEWEAEVDLDCYPAEAVALAIRRKEELDAAKAHMNRFLPSSPSRMRGQEPYGGSSSGSAGAGSGARAGAGGGYHAQTPQSVKRAYEHVQTTSPDPLNIISPVYKPQIRRLSSSSAASVPSRFYPPSGVPSQHQQQQAAQIPAARNAAHHQTNLMSDSSQVGGEHSAAPTSEDFPAYVPSSSPTPTATAHDGPVQKKRKIVLSLRDQNRASALAGLQRAAEEREQVEEEERKMPAPPLSATELLRQRNEHLQQRPLSAKSSSSSGLSEPPAVQHHVASSISSESSWAPQAYSQADAGSVVEESQSEAEFGSSSQAYGGEADDFSDEDDEGDGDWIDDDIDLLYSKRRNQRALRDGGALGSGSIDGRFPGSSASVAGGSSSAMKPSTRIRRAENKLPAKRLQEALEDLFEAEDTIPSADTLHARPHWSNAFFEALDEGKTVVLREPALYKFLRLIKGASKRFEDIAMAAVMDKATLEATYPPPRQLYEIDTKGLGRLLKILEKTATAAADVQPVPVVQAPLTSPAKKKKLQGKKGKGAKGGRGRAKARSKSPAKSSELGIPMDEDEDEGAGTDPDETLRPDNSQTSVRANTPPPAEDSAEEKRKQRDHFTLASTLLNRGMLATECMFAIMTGRDAPKELLSEDVIQTGLEPLRLAIESVILPSIEVASSEGHVASRSLAFFHHLSVDAAPKGPTTTKKKGAKQTTPAAGTTPEEAEAFTSAARCLETITRLFERAQASLNSLQRLCVSGNVALADAVTITLVYLTLKPFFVSEIEKSATSSKNKDAVHLPLADALGGVAAAGKLRRPSFSLLRYIFSKQPQHRHWIIEEILTSLMKLPDMKKGRKQYHIASGASIHPVNALLIQLIQSAADVGATATDDLAFALDTTARDIASEGAEEKADETSAEAPTAAAVIRASLDGSISAAQSVVSFLLNKLRSHGKVIKSSTELNYASIIDSLVADLLTTLFRPEWPASSLLATRLAHALALLLEEKSPPDARGVAIEHLGSISAALRHAQHQLVESTLPWSKINEGVKINELETIVDGYVQTIALLDSQQDGDVQMLESAAEYFLAQALHDLDTLIQHVSTIDSPALLKAAQEGRRRIESCSSTSASSSIKTLSSDSTKTSRTCRMLSVTSIGFVSFTFLKRRLLLSVDEAAVGNRSKALRAIGAISTVDADLLEDEQVRATVETRLADSSPGVREAAVNLIGKFLLRKRSRISDYFAQLLARLHDSSLAVRKRVLKLLTGFYDILEDDKLRVELCVKVVRSISDEDPGVQQLALGAIGEMWFGLASVQEPETTALAVPVVQTPKASSSGPTASRGSSISSRASTTSAESDAGVDDLACHAAMITQVCGQLRERPSPLEEVFKRMMRSQGDEAAANSLHRKLKGLVERLINDLVADEAESRASFIDSIKTVHSIVSIHPTTLSLSKTKALLPYLKSAQTVSSAAGLQHRVELITSPLCYSARRASGVGASVANLPHTHADSPSHRASLC